MEAFLILVFIFILALLIARVIHGMETKFIEDEEFQDTTKEKE